MPAADGRTITINVRAITSGLIGPMNQAKATIKDVGTQSKLTVAQVEESTERISRLWRSALEAFFGVQAIKAMKDLALGAAEAADKLDVASRIAQNFGHALNAARMEQWLEQFAKSAQGGGYAIDQMRDAVQQFAALGLDAAQVQRAMADTAELAASRNLDFAQATNIVRYALTGHVDMLTRYGIVSREAAKGIHTVEQGMEAIEKSSAGAAEQRANSLVGEFGRLGTAMSLLGDKIGKGLEPFFNELTTLLTNFADALGQIPAPVMQFVGTVGALVTSLVAVTLILPALAKGLTIVREGFALLGVFVNPVLTFFARLLPTLGLATTGMEAFSVAELAAMGPVAALVLAIAAIGVAADELIRHLDHVKTAWHDWTQYLSDSFHEFAENFKRDHANVIELIEDLAEAVADPVHAQVYLSRLPMLAPNAAIKDGPALVKSTDQIGTDIVGDLKQAFASIGNFFKSSLGSMKIPGGKFTGTIPGKSGGSGADKAAQNALKNFDDALKGWLDQFQARIDRAKSQVDIATEKLADFDVKHPADQAMSTADQATRQRLVNDQLKAEAGLREATLEKMRAESAAAQKYLEYARSISTALKNHDQLLRSAIDAAREHAKNARDLYLNYLQAGTALDSIIAKERQAANERIDTAVDAANDAAQQAFDARTLQRSAQEETLRQPLAIEQAKGRQASPVAEDHLKISLDQLALAAAIDAEAVKQDALARARAAYDQTQSHADYQRLTEAQNALTQATLGVAKAEDQLTVDNAKLTTDQRAKWTDLINELIQKAGMPGLSLSGFNPAQFLIAAFEQSLAFADVMGTVNQIVRVFAQILSALRPVINALLDVVRTVVNVFIFLYDTLARILNMFGMQLQILNYLNGAYAGMVPLIEMWHEIPTLNELAAGKLNSPLSTIPQQLNNLGQQQGQGTMRIVGILVGILGAIIVAKMFAGLSFQQAIQQTAHLLGINVGQKFQTGLQTTTNGLIEQTNTILGELLSAFQSSQIGGGGGAGGVFGAILGLFTGGAGGGVVAAASTMGAAFQAAGTAAQSMGAAFQMASRSINAASESMARAAARTSTVVQQIDRSMSLSYAPQISASVASGYDVERLGTDVAETMLRKLQTGMYSLNRAPVL